MGVAAAKRSEGLIGAAIVGGVLFVCIIAVVFLAANNPELLNSITSAKEKYPAKAFVIKRQGSFKSQTTYTGLAAGSGLSVDLAFDKSAQKLSLKIKGRDGKPMSRVIVDARARKTGNQQNPKRIAVKEHVAGEYRSEPMGLEKGSWILAVTAYDLFDRGNNKLLFHTEKPVFFK